MTPKEKALGRMMITSSLIVMLLIIGSQIIWQYMNRPMMPVVIANGGDTWQVNVGTFANPAMYSRQISGDDMMVEEVAIMDTKYRVVGDKSYQKAVAEDIGNGQTIQRWQPIAKLPAEINRWYVSGAIALQEYREKHEPVR